MTLTDATMQDIRSDLVAGIETANHQRRGRRRIAILAPLMALVVTAVLVLPIGDRQSAFAMAQAADGSIRVEVYPGFDQVDDLRKSLEDAGLDAVVVHLKGHPSLDGVVEVSSHNNERQGALEFDGGEFVIDPAQIEGEIEVLIYTAAADGEPYQFAPSIFAPGQLLAGLPCAYPDAPLSTEELERRANQVGITAIEWVLFDRSIPGEIGSEESGTRPDAAVVGAQLANADTLRVIAALDATGPAAETLTLSDGTHYRRPVQCTPELAAQWE